MCVRDIASRQLVGTSIKSLLPLGYATKSLKVVINYPVYGPSNE